MVNPINVKDLYHICDVVPCWFASSGPENMK
jgi:hypothetical protein